MSHVPSTFRPRFDVTLAVLDAPASDRNPYLVETVSARDETEAVVKAIAKVERWALRHHRMRFKDAPAVISVQRQDAA